MKSVLISVKRKNKTEPEYNYFIQHLTICTIQSALTRPCSHIEGIIQFACIIEKFNENILTAFSPVGIFYPLTK